MIIMQFVQSVSSTVQSKVALYRFTSVEYELLASIVSKAAGVFSDSKLKLVEPLLSLLEELRCSGEFITLHALPFGGSTQDVISLFQFMQPAGFTSNQWPSWMDASHTLAGIVFLFSFGIGFVSVEQSHESTHSMPPIIFISILFYNSKSIV